MRAASRDQNMPHADARDPSEMKGEKDSGASVLTRKGPKKEDSMGVQDKERKQWVWDEEAGLHNPPLIGPSQRHPHLTNRWVLTAPQADHKGKNCKKVPDDGEPEKKKKTHLAERRQTRIGKDTTRYSAIQLHG